MMAIIVSLICAVIAALIASRKGRSVVGWAFGGFFLGLIGVIIVACLPNRKEERAHRARSEREQRRLREQLRQEKLKSEAFRRHSTARFDAHDHVLGVDTRSTQVLLGEPSDRGLTQSGGDSVPPPVAAAAWWYYEANGESKGPVSELEIKNLLQLGKIGSTSLLWTEGLSEWTRANEIDTFRDGASS